MKPTARGNNINTLPKFLGKGHGESLKRYEDLRLEHISLF